MWTIWKRAGAWTVIGCLSAAGLAGCKDPAMGPAASNPATTTAGAARGGGTAVVGPAAGAPAGDALPDLTPPDVKLVKVDFKVDDVMFTMQAPEGSVVKAGFLGTSIVKGDDFAVNIQLGKSKFLGTQKWWADGGGFLKPKRIFIQSPTELLVESTETPDARYASAALASVPYYDVTVESAKDGGMGASVMSKSACLLVLKCAKTLALKDTPPPETDPVAVLKWLNADLGKDENDKVAFVGIPHRGGDSTVPLLKKIPTLKRVELCDNVTGAGAAQLAGMQNLEGIRVELPLRGGSGEVIRQIAKIPNLTSVWFGTTIGAVPIDEDALASLAALKKLESLDLVGSKAGDKSLAAIREITWLKSLSLGSKQSSSERQGPDRMQLATLTDAGLPSLAGLTKLESLVLRRTDVKGTGFKGLSLPKLEELDLTETFTDDEGLRSLDGLKGLKVLALRQTPVRDLSPLAALKELKDLDLNNTDVTDASLKALAALPNLERLLLQSTAVTDAGLAHLSGLKKLQTLNLSSTKVTDAGLTKLYKIGRFATVHLSGTAVTAEGKKNLEKALEE